MCGTMDQMEKGQVQDWIKDGLKNGKDEREEIFFVRRKETTEGEK